MIYATAGDGSLEVSIRGTEGASRRRRIARRERGGREGGAWSASRAKVVAGRHDGRVVESENRGGPRDEARASESASAIGMDAMKKPSASFVLTSPEVADGGKLPVDYTGDGSGATLPLAWKGAPAGTQSYALVMDHLAPGNVVKSYWTMWDIPGDHDEPAEECARRRQTRDEFQRAVGYEPPHSQGPGREDLRAHRLCALGTAADRASRRAK